MMDHDLHRTLRIAENTIKIDSEDSEQSMINPAVLMIDLVAFRMPRIIKNTIQRNHGDSALFLINPVSFLIDHVWL